MAVIDPPSAARPLENIARGVWLKPPVAIGKRLADAMSKKDADSLADLQAAESLLSGMMNSDGVIILGTDASVLAFRVFLRPKAEEREQLPDRGGGRRRTYELMKLRLPSLFHAVLFRSQDGETACERRNPIGHKTMRSHFGQRRTRANPRIGIDTRWNAGIRKSAARISTRDTKSIISAFESGSYEMMATFVWSKAAAVLKKQLASLGMEFVGEMLRRQEPDRRF